MPAPAGGLPAGEPLLGPGDVRRLLAEHGVRPSRALGQNFVADPNTVRRIVRLAGVGPDARVVEIGAGLGSLTRALAATGATVVAVEVDRHLLPVLRGGLGGLPNVTIVAADVRDMDWDLLPAPGAPWQVVANLPYNVATPLVVELLETAPQLGSLFVMVQREVGERLAAAPGQKAYGAVSVKVAYWATAKVAGIVPPTVFVPRPAVESALVRIVRRAEPAVPAATATYERLCSVLAAGFGQRRKMLRRSLAGVVPEGAFAGAGVDPAARAEELDVETWGRLAGWQPGAADPV